MGQVEEMVPLVTGNLKSAVLSSAFSQLSGPWEEGDDLGMSHRDSRRKWMWLFLFVLAAVQLYAVRELLAAFALFALGFGAITLCVMSLYLLHKTWEAGVARMAASQHPVFLAARRSVAIIEDWARRPIRRPDSEPAR
jgi:hypothetical protein